MISINFLGEIYVCPSWDGPMECPKCKGNAYSIGGFNNNIQQLTYHSWCKCGWEDKAPNWDTRNEKKSET